MWNKISTEIVSRLYEKYPHVCALKEAGGKSTKVSETMGAVDSDFVILSGDDGLTLPFMSCGAKGVISVASNIIPSVVSSLVQHALNENYQRAREIHLKYYQFFTDIFMEPNPVPIKSLLHYNGLINSPEVRLPFDSPNRRKKRITQANLKKS